MSDYNKYVAELDLKIQKQIKVDIEQSIIDMGIYEESEINDLVDDAMDSKLSELAETIDIKKYNINEV